MGEISFDELSIEPLSSAHNSALAFFDLTLMNISMMTRCATGEAAEQNLSHSS
jgi:hypothetical protein